MTLEQIVNQMRNFSVNHTQLKGNFFEGRLTQAEVNKTNLYYRMICEVIPSTLDQGTETFDFRVGVFGRVNLEADNRLSTLSDTRQIITDFVSYFKNNPALASYLKIRTPVTLNDSVDYSDDGVSGYFADISISQYQGLSFCTIPIESASSFILQEDGFYILQEDGFKLILN